MREKPENRQAQHGFNFQTGSDSNKMIKRNTKENLSLKSINTIESDNNWHTIYSHFQIIFCSYLLNTDILG